MAVGSGYWRVRMLLAGHSWGKSESGWATGLAHGGRRGWGSFPFQCTPHPPIPETYTHCQGEEEEEVQRGGGRGEGGSNLYKIFVMG